MRKNNYNLYIMIGGIAAGIIVGLVGLFILGLSELAIAGIAIAVGPYLF